MGVLRIPFMISPAHATAAEVVDLDATLTASTIANNAAPVDIANNILFGAPKGSAKPITDGPYHTLIDNLEHPELNDAKSAMAEGRLYLLTDAPAANGSRTVVYGHANANSIDKSKLPEVATKIVLNADGQIKSGTKDKLIHVWAYESDPGGPLGLRKTG